MKIADKLFYAHDNYLIIKDELEILLSEIIDDSRYNKLTWDGYDSSIQFREADPTLELTPEQQQKLWNLGFMRAWIISGNQNPAPDSSSNVKYYFKNVVGDQDPNEDFICGECGKEVNKRIIFCSNECQVKFEKQLIDSQVTLSPKLNKILYDNAWDLYDNNTTPEARKDNST